MSGDRRRTPPGGIRSSEDRDLQAMKARASARARSQHDTIDDGTPEDFADSEREVTKPHEIQDFRSQMERDAIQKRYDTDPAFRALWNLMRRQRHESNRSLGKVADAATSVHQDVAKLVELGQRLDDIAQWKHEVDVMLKITKWVLGVVFTIALGSVIVMATKIYTWGVSSGELEIRIQHLEKAIERRRNDPQYPSPASTVPSIPLPGATKP